MGMLRGNAFKVHGRTILLTGGSQGMGLAIAKILAAKGANIIIVARNQGTLDTALVEIKGCAQNAKSQSFHAISADVTLQSENKRILEEATALNSGNVPEIVWANAGASTPSLFLDTDMEVMRKQMDVNYWSAAYLAQYTMRAWLSEDDKVRQADATKQSQARAPRHLIMTSSIIVFLGGAGYGPYAPSKAALRSLADTLHSEVNVYNSASQRTGMQPIKIHLVVPGTMLTPGFDLENQSKHPVTHVIEEGDVHQTAEEAAAASIKGLENGEYLIATHFIGKLLRAGGLGGSQRSGVIGIRDTFLAFVASIVWLFTKPQLDRKVAKWGRDNARSLEKPQVE